MEILKHRLVDGGVQHLVCRKNSRKLSGSDMIVVHYTAGTSARTAAECLAKEEVKEKKKLDDRTFGFPDISNPRCDRAFPDGLEEDKSIDRFIDQVRGSRSMG